MLGGSQPQTPTRRPRRIRNTSGCHSRLSVCRRFFRPGTTLSIKGSIRKIDLAASSGQSELGWKPLLSEPKHKDRWQYTLAASAGARMFRAAFSLDHLPKLPSPYRLHRCRRRSRPHAQISTTDCTDIGAQEDPSPYTSTDASAKSNTERPKCIPYERTEWRVSDVHAPYSDLHNCCQVCFASRGSSTGLTTPKKAGQAPYRQASPWCATT